MTKLATINRAREALGQAVERYDAMGWYDENYASEDQMAEAAEAEAALSELGGALDQVGGSKAWIFIQPYSDLEPFAGLVFADTEDAARRQVLDRWREEGSLREPPAGDDYAAYLDEAGDWYLRIVGPFVIASGKEKNPQPMHKWADKIARCLGPTVDVRLSIVEFATIEDDAMGMEETRGDHARETVDEDEAAELQAKAEAWGSVSLAFGKIRRDLDRRARKAGCR